ncbi:MAG TPA: BON domain-containing protein [Bryobacteraceae bacterium]|nr:BON domain-containing protein [Bryobacteraceae bacterium]
MTANDDASPNQSTYIPITIRLQTPRRSEFNTHEILTRRFRWKNEVWRRSRIVELSGAWLIAFAILFVFAFRTSAVLANTPFTDTRVNDAVEYELVVEKGVSPNFIDVSTSQGIVTLSGSVNDLLAKARAVKIAESVRGVRAVIDRITVTPVSRPDEDIRKDILTALLQDPATESYQISVSVTNGVVALSGSVGSWPESQLAQRVAEGVKGAKEIHNDLTINYLAKRTDEEIAADVEAALRWDIWVNGQLVDVQVKNGNVTLSGSVGSALVKSRAIQDAWVMGVTSVDANQVQVDPMLRVGAQRRFRYSIASDADIQQAVEAAFRRDPRVAPFSPNVRVEDNTVILSGAVGNLKAKMAASQDARDTVGVWWVENYLRVRPKNPPSDADIEKNLNAALFWDPGLVGGQIQAAVINHVAYLSGAVDDDYQRFEAQDVAARTKGVVEVRNRLHVEPQLTLSDSDSYYNWPDYYDGPLRYDTGLFAPLPLKTDAQVRKDIEKAFFWSPFVDRDDIKLTVHNGVATLTGKVDGWIAYGEAQRDAYKGGASFVVNRLQVKKGAWF